MTQIENISKGYGGRLLFSDANFRIGKNERCALVGRNGSGKTTLLKILTGDEEADSGSIYFAKHCRIGTLPQHLHFDQPTLLEEAILGLPEEIRDESFRVEKLLSGLGFSTEEFSMSPQSFSGGYQLRLALCKVLAGDPDLLILDEPTNYLDVVAIRWLENYLRSWQGQLIFVSHDRSFVNKVCTHIIGIHRTKVLKVRGDLSSYTNSLEIQEETHERTREKMEKKKAHMQSFIDRFGSKATKATQAQARAKAIAKMDNLEELQDQRNLAFQFRYKNTPNKQVFTIQDLLFDYNNNENDPLISDLTFDCKKRDRIGIIGKNGRGKSTVLQLLAEEIQPQSGTVVLGHNTSLAYFGQTNIARLHPDNTVEEEVLSAAPTTSYAALRGACGVMLFSGDDAKKKISVLSGGEKSRVLLAKILLTPANLLLLDEPSHHLDMESVDALMTAIDLFEGAVILVSHNESILKRLKADKLVICSKDRQKVFLGDYETFLEKCSWEDGQTLTKPTEKKNSRKEERRLRAENVQKRSQKLRPITQAIKKIEKQVENLEKKKNELEETLVSAVNDPNINMHELAHQHGQESKKLEILYDELQKLMEQEEKIKNEFPV